MGKEKCQDFEIQFADRRFCHRNVLALLFRKALSRKCDKFAELVEDSCIQVLDKYFVGFSLSVQDLVESKVSAESNAEKAECDMHQGDKVGSSAAGELTRSKGNAIVSAFPKVVDLMTKLHKMVKHFKLNPANRKIMI